MAVIGPRKITRKSAAIGTLIIAPALGLTGFAILPIAAILGSEPEEERGRSSKKTKAQGKKKAIRKDRI